MRITPRVLIFLSLAFTSAVPAVATAVHQYGKDEFAVIGGGEAPDRKHAIAAHGEGEFGDENFHLYLMAEPGHKRIGPLEEVTDVLDTAPGAFDARWTKDSRYVAIQYRVDRHVSNLLLYRIDNGRAFPVAAPSLVSIAAGFTVEDKPEIEVRAKWQEFEWTGSGRFTLKETGTLEASLAFARKLTAIAKEPAGDEASSDAPQFIEYEIEADCEIAAGDKLVVRTKLQH